MDAPQLELDFDSPQASLGRVFSVKTIDMGEFGNKTIVYFVDGTDVRVVTHLDFDAEKVKYFDHLS